MKSTSGSGAAAAPAPDPKAFEQSLGPDYTPEEFCAQLAKVFRVRKNEVALLKLQSGLLKFVVPAELSTAGSIPVSSSTAVAAHTAVTKKVELFNAFAKVKHARVFETVKLNTHSDVPDPSEQTPIQKLMSAPVLSNDGKVLGVIQISRKGFDPASAGPDFGLDDLQSLEHAAKTVARASFMR